MRTYRSFAVSPLRPLHFFSKYYVVSLFTLQRTTVYANRTKITDTTNICKSLRTSTCPRAPGGRALPRWVARAASLTTSGPSATSQSSALVRPRLFTINGCCRHIYIPPLIVGVFFRSCCLAQCWSALAQTASSTFIHTFTLPALRFIQQFLFRTCSIFDVGPAQTQSKPSPNSRSSRHLQASLSFVVLARVALLPLTPEINRVVSATTNDGRSFHFSTSCKK